MRKTSRRILALALSLALVVGLMPLQVLSETTRFSLFSLPAPMPETFVADGGSYSGLTDTSSTNNHTYPRHIWVQDGYIYFAGYVQHKKEFGVFTIEGLTPDPVDYVKMSRSDTLTIAGTVVIDESPGSSNVWWVARYPVGSITLDGSYSYTMIVGSGGHDIPVGTVQGALLIDKTSDRTEYRADDTINYTIKVTNNTNVSITNLEISDKSTASDANAKRILSTNGTLAATTSTTVTYAYVATAADVAAGRIVNQASATGKSGMTNFAVSDNVTVYAVVEVPVSKDWINTTGEANPTQITARLLRNGDVYKTETLNAANQWAHAWTNLALTDLEGTDYTYTVDEADVPGYEKQIDQETGEITNTRQIIEEINVLKIWANVPEDKVTPSSVTVELLRNGTPFQEIKLNEANGWQHKWENLARTDLEGKAYQFTLTESQVPDGYTAAVTGD